ncbi:hypothetical protein, partial [Deinococcus saxicola]|uniref:hypothetical protein n=1 Tax=Deinococcus saxicola TaxID=249406 RepID=UPI003D125B69
MCFRLVAPHRGFPDTAPTEGIAEDSLLKHAPHTQEDPLVAEWNRAHSREVGAFPSAAQKQWKYWPSVNRVDNVYGDRNFV